MDALSVAAKTAGGLSLIRSELNTMASRSRSANVTVIMLGATLALLCAARAQSPLVIDANGVTMNGSLTVSGAVDVPAPGLISGKGAVPVGTIVMWSGDPQKLPEGWALCDGNGSLADGKRVPDLSGQFVMGYDPAVPHAFMLRRGGEKAHTLTRAEMPVHSHGVRVADQQGNDLGFQQSRGNTAVMTDTGGFFNKILSWRNVAKPVTASSIRLKAEGDGKAFDIRPPYYVLAYIIFTGNRRASPQTVSAALPVDQLIVSDDRVAVAANLRVNGGIVASGEGFAGLGALPVGAIMMWSGSAGQTPPGWHLCDGKTILPNGRAVPDLRGRFIVGYDAKNPDYACSGTSACDLKKDGRARHVLTVQELPQHDHDMTWFFDIDAGNFEAVANAIDGPDGMVNVAAPAPRQVTLKISPEGEKTPKAFDMRPPYFVVAFIIYGGR